MSKPEWGQKRDCQGCGARFYDLKKDPIICPKCGETLDPEPGLKSRRSRPPAAEKAAAPAAEETATATSEAEGGVPEDQDASLKANEGDDIDDEEDDEDDPLAAAAELNADDDDLSEVVGKVEVETKE